jgi:hypothetical protein
LNKEPLQTVVSNLPPSHPTGTILPKNEKNKHDDPQEAAEPPTETSSPSKSKKKKAKF